jgi:hypothetical protein
VTRTSSCQQLLKQKKPEKDKIKQRSKQIEDEAEN